MIYGLSRCPALSPPSRAPRGTAPPSPPPPLALPTAKRWVATAAGLEHEQANNPHALLPRMPSDDSPAALPWLSPEAIAPIARASSTRSHGAVFRLPAGTTALPAPLPPPLLPIADPKRPKDKAACLPACAHLCRPCAARSGCFQSIPEGPSVFSFGCFMDLCHDQRLDPRTCLPPLPPSRATCRWCAVPPARFSFPCGPNQMPRLAPARRHP